MKHMQFAVALFLAVGAAALAADEGMGIVDELLHPDRAVAAQWMCLQNEW
jgi:hypothetical protein